MKRILIITQNFYPEIGSAANRLKNIYVELKQRGYDVKVLTTEPSYPSRNIYKDESFWDEEQNDGDIIRIQTRTRKYTRNIVKRLVLYLEVAYKLIIAVRKLDQDYDYVFVSSPPIFVGIAGVFAKRRMRAKLILDVRDLWPESLVGVGVFNHRLILKLAYELERYLYRAANHILINSKGFMPYLKENGITEDRISFMPNSLTEEELYMPSDHQENQTITVIYTGNIGLAQDILKLIAIAEHLQHCSFIRFKIIGYGYQKGDVEKLIEQKGLTNIEILPPKSRKETLKELASAHIAYVSLLDRSVFQTVLPGKVIDYMCMKKPIIGDVSGYARHVIEQAQCGIVSEHRTVEQISDMILHLASNEELRRQLGEQGHEYAVKKWRWKTNIEVLIHVMEEQCVEETGLHVRMESFHK